MAFRPLQRLRNAAFHPDPALRTSITLCYTGIGLLVNFFLLQVFCTPVPWAAVYTAVCFLALLLAPRWMPSQALRPWGLLVLGAGVPACLYGILFLADPWSGFRDYLGYVLGIVLLGAGLLAFIPVYLLYHTVRYYQAAHGGVRWPFWCGVILPLLVAGLSLSRFRASDRALQHAMRTEARQADWQAVPRNYFTERLTGIGFKYHTKLEYVYDGWRPPLHDPLLNAYLWFYSDTFFPRWPVNRLAVYRALFPDHSVWVFCPCSFMRDGRTYFEHDTSAFVPHP